MIKKKEKRYEFVPEPDMFVSEILCERCKNKNDCDPKEDVPSTCNAYRALNKEMP